MRFAAPRFDSYTMRATFCLIATAILSAFAYGQVSNRVQGPIEESSSFTALTGHVRPAVARAKDEGLVSPSHRMPRMALRFAKTTEQTSQLEQLLMAQQTHGNALYHQWLTPAQYADRFGVSQQDVERIAAWLRGAGFTQIEIAPSRTSVSFSGTVAQAQAAFRTSIHSYLLDGETHIANATDPALPAAMAEVVENISGLHDFRPHAQAVAHSAGVKAHYTAGDGENFLAPDDFATIYDLAPLYNAGINGSGQTIAIVGQSDINMSDVQAFRSAAGLSQNKARVLLVGDDPGTIKGDEAEAELDLEWAGAVARNANLIYINSGNAFESAVYAIENNVSPILSISYAACEAEFTASEAASSNSFFELANAEGITVLAGSGDAGAAACDDGAATATHGLAVGFPATSPYVTGVGGTTFNEDFSPSSYWRAGNSSKGASAMSYIPEDAWNDTAEMGTLWASGGGKSKLFRKLYWQTGSGIPNDGARDVPDVAFAASPQHDGYLVCVIGSCVNGFFNSGGNLTVYGGTSLGTPSMAGVVALLDQWMGSAQGNIDPGLYLLSSIQESGNTSETTSVFHRVISGNNLVPCSAGSPDCPSSGMMGYTAADEYDEITGLGSIDVYNLIAAWGQDPVPFPSRSIGGVTALSAGVDGTLWGLDGYDFLWAYDAQTQTWSTANRSIMLKQLAVASSNAIWAIDWSNNVYRWDSSSNSLVQMPGVLLIQISVGADGDAWGVYWAELSITSIRSPRAGAWFRANWRKSRWVSMAPSGASTVTSRSIDSILGRTRLNTCPAGWPASAWAQTGMYGAPISTATSIISIVKPRVGIRRPARRPSFRSAQATTSGVWTTPTRRIDIILAPTSGAWSPARILPSLRMQMARCGDSAAVPLLLSLLPRVPRR